MFGIFTVSDFFVFRYFRQITGNADRVAKAADAVDETGVEGAEARKHPALGDGFNPLAFHITADGDFGGEFAVEVQNVSAVTGFLLGVEIPPGQNKADGHISVIAPLQGIHSKANFAIKALVVKPRADDADGTGKGVGRRGNMTGVHTRPVPAGSGHGAHGNHHGNPLFGALHRLGDIVGGLGASPL